MSKDLQHILYNYEVNPPARTWDKVAAALDESHLADQFPQTLYNMEVAPPATAWEKIKNSLGEPHEKKTPVRKIFFPLLKYAAAAVVIIALVVGGNRLFQSDRPANPVTEKTTIPFTEKNTTGALPDPAASAPLQEPVTRLEQDEQDEAALEASKKMYAGLDASEKQRIRRLSEAHQLYMADPISAAEELNPDMTYRDLLCTDVGSPSFAYPTDHSPSIDMATRYVMLMTPDGHFVRISKKLAPLACCVAGEDANEDCYLQLKKWREKLARPDAGTSPGNFLDLLHLIQLFKENNP